MIDPLNHISRGKCIYIKGAIHTRKWNSWCVRMEVRDGMKRWQ